MTARRVDPARLAALNARLRNMRVGDFSFVEQGLWLGALQGNRCDGPLPAAMAVAAAAVHAC